MALVVAMAGTMFPAIPLASWYDCGGMPKPEARRFAAAVTKRMAQVSSLSKAYAPRPFARPASVKSAATHFSTSRAQRSSPHTARVQSSPSPPSSSPATPTAVARATSAATFLSVLSAATGVGSLVAVL
jgi:hypothetical protein